MCIVRLTKDLSLSSIGFSSQNIGKQILVALCLVLYFLVCRFAVINILDITLVKSTTTIYSLVKSVLVELFLVGFGEELFYRGYVLETIKKLCSNTFVIVFLSALVFGVAHFGNMMPFQIGYTFVMGLVFAFCKLKFKYCTLFSLGLAHGLYDVINTLLLFSIK